MARDGFKEDAEIMAKADPNQFAELPGMLARWAAARPAMEAFKALQGCAMAAGPVRNPEDLIEDPHCAAREHPRPKSPGSRPRPSESCHHQESSRESH